MKKMKKMVRVFCLVLALLVVAQVPMNVDAATKVTTKQVDKLAKKRVKSFKKKTKATKLKASYKWVLGGKYKIALASGKTKYQQYAYNMMNPAKSNKKNYRKGNCYSYASAFAYLAKASGYKKVKIVTGKLARPDKDGKITTLSSHSWVVIGDKVYDPQMQDTMKTFQKVSVDLYGKTYEELKAINYNYTVKGTKKIS